MCTLTAPPRKAPTTKRLSKSRPREGAPRNCLWGAARPPAHPLGSGSWNTASCSLLWPWPTLSRGLECPCNAFTTRGDLPSSGPPAQSLLLSDPASGLSLPLTAAWGAGLFSVREASSISLMRQGSLLWKSPSEVDGEAPPCLRERVWPVSVGVQQGPPLGSGGACAGAQWREEAGTHEGRSSGKQRAGKAGPAPVNHAVGTPKGWPPGPRQLSSALSHLGPLIIQEFLFYYKLGWGDPPDSCPLVQATSTDASCLLATSPRSPAPSLVYWV